MGDRAPARIGLVAARIPDADVVPSPPDRLGGDATALDVVRAALAGSTIRLLRQDPAIRREEDPEAVHGARVAVRRLRSHLKTFRPLLDREEATDLRRELRWLAVALGEVRDAEVLRERLRARLAGLGGSPSVDPLLDELEARRTAGRRGLLAAMRSPRYTELLDRLVEWSAEPRGRARRAGWPAERAPALLDRPWRALGSHARALSSDPTDEELHRVRIETKRVRYAAEAVVPVIGKRAAKFARSAEALQEVLGEHQDAVTAMRWLEGHGTRTADPAVAFTSGRLAQLEAADRARSRTAWPDAWRSLARRKRFWI